MNNCSHDIKRKLQANDAFLKGAIMRIFVMAMLLLGFVGCGSVVENNPEYPALKLLKTERDSATGQVRATVLLMRTPYTKKLFYYSESWNTPLFVFKTPTSFALNENIKSWNSNTNSKNFSSIQWFKLNQNLSYWHFDVDHGTDPFHLVQGFPEEQEFTILVKDSDLNKKIGITFYPLNNSRIDLENPITIWTDEIPSIP